MTSVVYFVEALDTQYVKIGRTRDLRNRLINLSSANAGGCRLLCSVPGGSALEAHFHHAFAEYRLTGEWFTPSPAIADTIGLIKRFGVGALPAGFVEEADAELIPPVDTAYIQRLVRLSAAPAILGEPVPDAIARAARRCGVSVGRANSYWYGKAREVPAAELDAIRAAAVRYGDDPRFLREETARLSAALEDVGVAIDRMAGKAAGHGNSVGGLAKPSGLEGGGE